MEIPSLHDIAAARRYYNRHRAATASYRKSDAVDASLSAEAAHTAKVRRRMDRLYRAANREHIRTYDRQYYRRNPDRKIEDQLLYEHMKRRNMQQIRDAAGKRW